jgi:penicillin-binding protein 2
MGHDLERRRQFTRRALVLGGSKAAALAVLAGRLYYLQVAQSERYLTLSDENRITLRLIAPRRGRILDRLGRPLADNREVYRVLIVAERSQGVESTLDALSTLIALDESDLKRVLRDIERQRRFVPVVIRNDLSWEEVARVEVESVMLPGISVDEGFSRQYRYGHVLAPVLGYVAAVSDAETGADPLLDLPDFRIGKAGIEKSYDIPLRGTAGAMQLEVNAVGRTVRVLDRRESEPGIDLTLGIDLDLQRTAVGRLGSESGSAVVVDVHTGEILVMASTPTYDPEAFNRGLSVEEWKTLVRDPKTPLINKAISGLYAPGSTFKPVVALAGLERGAITPSTAVLCTGVLRLGDFSFHCWRRGGHGSVRLREALMQSCDCYFYEVARRVGVDRIAEMGRRLGLGAPLCVDIPHEREGFLPTRSWKMATFGTPWSMGETVITGIGQGYVLSTPLQLAVMTARIANGGRAVVPHLARDPDLARSAGVASTPQETEISSAHLRVVQEGLYSVVNSAGGTAKDAAIRISGFAMAGKTGTSQVRRISRAERKTGVVKNEHLPWEKRDHALFIGYAPYEEPRYAIAVIIEHGGAGSKAAAPVARDILIAARKSEQSRVAGRPGNQLSQLGRSG